MILVGWTFFWSYQKIFPVLPTCQDGIQNQNETGIDCGGVCETACPLPPKPGDAKEIEVGWVKAVSAGVNTYDLAAKIVNSNKRWGLESFDYELNVRDKSGAVVLTKTGKSYILPDSYDYIIIPSQKLDIVPSDGDLELRLSEEKWVSVNEDYGINALSFSVSERNYTVKDSNGFPSASGIVTNGTTYDFAKMDIKIALFSDDGELVAVNALDMNTMYAKDKRYFRSIWDTVPAKTVTNMDFVVTANAFDSTNFMKRYGTGSKVEEYR